MRKKVRSLLSMIGQAPDDAAEVIDTYDNTKEGEGDAAIRKALAERGDDGTKPRHTLFYFYDGNQAGLRAAAERAGFDVREVQGGDGSVLETTIAVDEASFAPVRVQMKTWAMAFGADFDGWECAVEAD